ncbi:MAG: hypothetical protein HYX89_07255 [Chloroflexi bacterium]|nr:hypothetical protein [Chloroflexota bacterium]
MNERTPPHPPRLRGGDGRGLLRQALRRLAHRGSPRPPLNAEPCCPFGLVLRQRVDDLDRELGEVRGRVNALLLGVVATFISVVVEMLVGRM